MCVRVLDLAIPMHASTFLTTDYLTEGAMPPRFPLQLPICVVFH